MIFIHELGHYTCARIFGVGINEFAIGMGPKLFSVKSKKTDISYSLRLLPIGGFVSMVGEDEKSDDEKALSNKPVWQRIIITAAGAFMNIVLAVILMFVLCICQNALGSTEIAEFIPDETTQISLSEQSGLMVDDEILSVDGVRVHTSFELAYTIMRNCTEPVDIVVMRNGEKITVEDVEFPTSTQEGILCGESDFYVKAEEKTFGNILKHALFQSIATVRIIWESLFDLVTGRYGIDQVSGPVGVTSVISDAAKTGILNLIYITALISMNLGVCNLLPIPALDGGRLFFQFIELIFRKKIPEKVEGIIHFVGLVILMAFMLFIVYKDIVKLIIK